MLEATTEPRLFELIYDTVRQIPAGRVASYGQISKIVGRCSAQMIGFALAALGEHPEHADVPWQRVINSQGRISPHGFGFGGQVQRNLLADEGVEFDEEGSVDFERFGWLGAPLSTKKKGRKSSC
jgi:methylated-DNA-protein-cysteine methyltransferase-like protein